MNNLIQWPRAKYWTDAWNPFVGCRPCSPACANCYAAAWAGRFKQSFDPHKSAQETPANRGVVFCGNMTDLFGEWVEYPEFYIGVASGRAFAPGHGRVPPTYLWLTKRTKRMKEVLNRLLSLPGDLKNLHYFGFTAENQEWLDLRYRDFRMVPTCWKGWLSAEPLLGPIDLGLRHVRTPEAMPFSWVVVGCESGPRRRPCKLEWVESIVHQCVCAGVPVFVKQLDLGGRCVTDITRFPEHLRIRQVPWAAHGDAAERRG